MPLPGGADACAGLRTCRARSPIPHVGRVRRSRHPAQKQLPTRSHCPAALALARAYPLTGARRPITNVGRVRRSRHPAQKRRPTRCHCPAALTLARAYELAGPAVPSRM
ncbi:hypothetical protein DMP50_04625 [Klebsiella pneumoniae]|nr:hypothetical protein DMQ99_07415 [Klebsiella pneumoniae]PXI41577.1 hypothetical protein DMP50_04625 [Klebsiella pneumoniae]PXJ59921.1 hypothetical protein DMR22_08050 [Klebsiella pneumoniae]RRF31402.1 hypothetical protein EAN94_20960 [Klebsiella pneumoniae]